MVDNTRKDNPEDPTLDESAAATVKADAADPARQVGPYRLFKRLGEGAMGEVWAAEQLEPVRRRVALKVIKRGMDSRQIVARFEAERQALAIMDHPCVAKVFDVGTTPGGRPYFAMEYVAGVPVTEHCDTHRLDTRARLVLFAQICDGVQHAHQKAIIHRDLKPSNILVAMQDDKAVPKIIDFGVAKALGQSLTDKTMFTEMGMLIGTPEYMSPEQADLTAQDIDTRTDVYALGVILYQLLVGSLPFESATLRQAGINGIRRLIREEEPPKPSTRLATMGVGVKESAHRRRTDPTALRRRLSGDLDWIVMKALEKDRGRRYGTPSELAADIGRHLEQIPVTAGPPTASYRAGKFVRRHRVGVGATAVVALVLITFAIAMGVQTGRIAAERDRANAEASRANREALAKGRVSEFLQNLFTVSDPGEARGNSITARELLDRGADSIAGMADGEPVIAAELMGTIGNVYRKLGLYDRAEPLLKQSLTTRKRELGEEHPDTLASINYLASLYLRQGRYEQAEPLFDANIQKLRKVLGADHPRTLKASSNLALLYVEQGRLEEAEPIHRQTLADRARALGEDHADTLDSMENLALVYARQRRSSEAEPLLSRVIKIRARVQGDDHPDTLRAKNSLALIYYHQDRFGEAEQLQIETLEARKRVLGTDHPGTLSSMNNLTIIYLAQSQYDRAEQLFQETLATQIRVLGEVHPHVAITLYNLACLEVARGESARAMNWLGQSVRAGFALADHMAEDAELAILHGPEFDRLLDRVRANAAARTAN